MKSATQSPDILIVGAGIIGCSLARELARVERSILVLDSGRVGGGASSAAAGLLTPALMASAAGALADLCHESAALYESWASELRADGAADVGFRRAGLLEAFREVEEANRARSFVTAQAWPNRPVEWIAGTELGQREPGLTVQAAGALLYPQDAQVDPGRLTIQVARVAELAGVTIREDKPIRQLLHEGDRITEVRTSDSTYHPGLVILTAGAWTGQLLEPLGVSLPTRPVKGQMLEAACRVSPVRTPLFVGDTLMVPRPDGHMLLGVTVEERGFDDRVTLDAIRTILNGALGLVPAAGPLSLVRAWAGLRPATPDGLPYMGPVLPIRNLWVSTGHFRKGILLAPLCAQLVARSILAGRLVDELLPFKPTRRLTGS